MDSESANDNTGESGLGAGAATKKEQTEDDGIINSEGTVGAASFVQDGLKNAATRRQLFQFHLDSKSHNKISHRSRNGKCQYLA